MKGIVNIFFISFKCSGMEFLVILPVQCLDLEQPIRNRPQHAAVSEEALYMQLLAAEHSGEEPDDGELEDDHCG